LNQLKQIIKPNAMKTIIPTLHIPKEKKVINKNKIAKNSFDASLVTLGWRKIQH
jgi:hypothetical protein